MQSEQVERPYFSVVICTWNRAHLLPRALDSLIAQTERSWSVVVVDDASTDATAEVLQTYQNVLHAMVIRRHAHNRGTAAARNSGIMAAQGRYVTFLDSDDAYDSNHLAERRALIDSLPNLHIIHGGVRVVGDPMVIDKDNPSRLIHVDECVVGGTFVIHRDVFEAIGYFREDLRYADDAEFFKRAETAGLNIGRCTVPSYVYYRDGHDQLTLTGSSLS